MNSIDPLRGAGKTGQTLQTGKKSRVPEGSTRFKDTLNGFISDVNSLQNKADDSVRRLVSGETSDIHEVMNTAQEAKTAFNMMMEMRKKVISAYDEVMRMRL
ncbi:MAG: flagellar hook-basal body complex protein FliE [Fibrobacterota bacterium]